MRTCNWGVVGYGLQIDEPMFDYKKLSAYFGTNFESARISLDDIVRVISIGSRLKYGDTGNSELGSFIIYSPNFPWSMTDEEKLITKEDIENEIVNVLLPYLKDEYTEEWIRQNIDYISLGGEG